MEIISRNFKHTYVFGGGPEARGHLATLSKAQSMIRKEQKATGQKVTQEQKRSAIEILKGKTEKESEIELFSLFQAAASVSEDKATRISATETELRLAISNELLEKLNRVKEIWAHRNSSFTWAELDEAMTNDCLKRHDPKLKSQSKALTQARLGQKAASEVSRRNQNPSNRSPIAADNASALRGLK